MRLSQNFSTDSFMGESFMIWIFIRIHTIEMLFNNSSEFKQN